MSVVAGNVTVGTGTIETRDGGRIDGARSVGIGNVSQASPGGVGHWTYVGSGRVGFSGNLLGRFLSHLLLNLVVTGIVVTIFPVALRQVIGEIESRPVRAGMTGCLVMIAWLVAIVGLAILIIGIPLSILLGIVGVLAFLLANAAVAWLIGMRVERTVWPNRPGHPYTAILVGGAALTIVEMVPGVGPLLELVVAAVGLGAIVQSRMGLAIPWLPPRN